MEIPSRLVLRNANLFRRVWNSMATMSTTPTKIRNLHQVARESMPVLIQTTVQVDRRHESTVDTVSSPQDHPQRRTMDASNNSTFQFGSNQIERLQNHLVFLELQHGLAAEYFNHRKIWYDLVPSLLLTLGSSLSALMTEHFLQSNSYVLLSIGAMTAIATFHKGISAAMKYGTQSDMHKTAAKSLDDIKDSLERLLILKQCSTLNAQNLEQRVNEAIKNCNSSIPGKISSQFDALSARFPFTMDDATETAVYDNPSSAIDSSSSTTRELWGLYMQELNRSITGHYLWPTIIPNCLHHVPQAVESAVEKSYDSSVTVVPTWVQHTQVAQSDDLTL